MKKVFTLLGIACLCLSSTSAGLAGAPQIKYEAAAIAEFPTSDACVHTLVLVDVVEFLAAHQRTTVSVQGQTDNVCTGASIHAVASDTGPVYADERSFIVRGGGASADLDVTFAGVDYALGRSTTIHAELHWTSTARAPSDSAAIVTGTVTSDSGFAGRLDDSIHWNPWASAEFPWAGLWRCVGSSGRPECIGPS